MPSYGLKQRTPDSRDYQLSAYLPADWQTQLAAFKADKKKVFYQPVAFTDQDGYGHCTMFTEADFENTPPVVANPPINDALAHQRYYDMVAWLGRPGDEGGAQMRELMSFTKSVLKRIDAYAWAASVPEVQYWLAFKGPVFCGTEWLTGMEYCDANGFVNVSGSIAGYHAWSFVGWDSATDVYDGLNHWSSMTLFKINAPGVAKLLADMGEYIMTPELERGPTPMPEPNGCSPVAPLLGWARRLGYT